MKKNILILNGSPRHNGNTSRLVEEFTKGAEKAGHEVTTFNIQQMNIHSCLGCLGGGKDPDSPCVQKDDMLKIYPHFEKADILVFATPLYYWTITAQLKMVIDRLFAVQEKTSDYAMPMQHCIMLMAAEGDTDDNFEAVKHYYHALLRHLGWENLKEIYAGGVMKIGDIEGHPALEEAYILGTQI